jgi:hypothetical protein
VSPDSTLKSNGRPAPLGNLGGLTSGFVWKIYRLHGTGSLKGRSVRWRKKAKKAAASATNGAEQGESKEDGDPQFISNFEVCKNQNHRYERRAA